MTTRRFTIFIIFTVCPNFIFHPSHGFEVIQPQYRTINLDGSASISCEHTANTGYVEDIRLYSVPLEGTAKPSLLCQKGMDFCRNITMYQESPNKTIFILLNIGPEAMNVAYKCEFTVRKDLLDITKTGTRTRLQRGQKEAEVDCASVSSPPCPQSHQLIWILIGLLTLTFLYACVITCVYIRLRVTNDNNNSDLGNCTYVEMRKAPLPSNPKFNISCA